MKHDDSSMQLEIDSNNNKMGQEELCEGEYIFVAPNEKPLVDIKNMQWTYFKQNILFDINLQLYPNEKCLLIGPNGAGKSSLLRILGGLHSNNECEKIDVMGTARPNDQSNGLTYMGNRWFQLNIR